jgi:wobble nucleotide-excising tRNase
VVESPLLAAYRDFFDAAYGELKNQVSTLLSNVNRQFGASTGLRWIDQEHGNRARQDAWADLVPSEHLPYNEPEGAKDLDGILEPVQRLLERKIANPLEAVGTPQDREQIEEACRTMLRRLDIYNEAVGELNERYAAAKREIEGGDVATIQRNIRDVQKAQLRYRPEVAQLVTDLIQAEADGRNAAQRKEQLREEHDRRMAGILGRYQDAINQRLQRLRAGFRIQQLRGGHPAGHAPRTVYAIQLRGATVTNLEHAADGPSVPNILSDGDRRALALAFFLARLDINDATLANAIIVFDDPMTSFDTARTAETIAALTELAARCRQLIVLSHDAYFLRDLNRALGNDVAQRTTYKIGYGDRDYAIFGTCDLTEACGQSHVIHQKAIAEYLTGRALDPRPPAEGLRILVEDFYKHRYPQHTHDFTTLGDIIQAVEGGAPTPLHALHHLLPALRDFNAYTSRYHHSTQGYRSAPIIEDRLRHYCRGALSLVHDEGRSYPLP